MLILVTGGSASGKSSHAEKIICKFECENRAYIATMMPFGDEAQERIARHHEMRKDRGFETIERYTDMKNLKFDKKYNAILLEDLGNLLANELFDENNGKDNIIEQIMLGIEHLNNNCNTLVIVSNEIFSDGVFYDPQTNEYIEKLGRLNTKISAKADAVCELVCSILVYKKGELLL